MRYETNLITGEVTEHEDTEVSIVPETADDVIARLEGVLDAHLDAVSKTYRYDTIMNMCDYRDDPNPKFKAEGSGAYKWRSAVYTLGIALIHEVTEGLRNIPTESDLIELLPKITDYIQYE
jgi:hypothetical protein